MNCLICKRKKKPAPEPARTPRVAAAAETARAPPKAARGSPPPEGVGPSSNGVRSPRNQPRGGGADHMVDEVDRMSGLTRNMETTTSTTYTYWNNYRDAHADPLDKYFYEDPNQQKPKPIPRSQFLQDYDLPETLMSSAETYYDYGCVGAPSFDAHPCH